MKMFPALLAIAALGLAACGSSSNTSSSSGNSSSASTSSNAAGGYGGAASTKTTAAVSSSSSGATEVEMDDNYFKPKTITGKAGSTVKIELKNEGNNEHNFKIDSQKADADVAAGKTATVSVKIPTSGTVQFYCEYHKGLGMVGTVKPS
jgi:plastocyanin